MEAAVAALRRAAPRSALCAAIGPHIGPCCYEVDAPVLTALFDSPAPPSPQLAPPNALRPTRPGHFLLNLGAVAQHRLTRAGLPAAHITTIPHPCTHCAPHFASYRRDGPQSGRILHWIAVPQRKE
ncbi:MAG: laccase domain-containing protein [Cyanobacteria bacterium MAG STY4_bin_9]|nr:laccase domain-containing protein [Cyanobacteria bacterium MAG STY4_bin_9]